MKLCLHCQTRFPANQDSCPNCSSTTERVDGFSAYAPQFAHEGGGFKPEYFADLAKLESENFWFRTRNELILWCLQRYLPNFENYLEIGCGTGFVLSGIHRSFPKATLFGSEIFTAGLHFAAERLPEVNFFQMDARQIPFAEEFEVIGAFDVIEHIQEDEEVLQQIHAALKPSGHLLLTVPQHDWLWSPIDDYAHHHRRYRAKELHEKVTEAGFTLKRSSSFVSTLLPAMLLSRAMQKGKSVDELDATSELKIPPLLNGLFGAMNRIDIGAIKLGLNLPLGGSRLVLAQKN